MSKILHLSTARASTSSLLKLNRAILTVCVSYSVYASVQEGEMWKAMQTKKNEINDYILHVSSRLEWSVVKHICVTPKAIHFACVFWS